MKANKKIKVGLMTHNISHYEVPLYRQASKLSDIDFEVIYWREDGVKNTFDPLFDRNLSWGTELISGYKSRLINIWRVCREIKMGRYDTLIIYGYSGWDKIFSILSAKALGIPLIFRGTATLLDRRSPIKEFTKRIFLSFLFKMFESFMVGGTYNKNFFRHYGVKDEQMFLVPFGVDTHRFLSLHSSMSDKRGELKKKFGLGDAKVILFVGNLNIKKGPHKLLEAFKKIVDSGEQNLRLLIAGDGILRDKLISYIRTNNLEKFVTCAGYLDQNELPEAYMVSDLVVFPSQFDETWSRAVNEAMAFGLPIIASQKVGATGDIVINGKNGYVVKEYDTSDIAAKITMILSNDNLRYGFGSESAKIIEGWTYEKHIRAFSAAIKFATKKNEENSNSNK